MHWVCIHVHVYVHWVCTHLCLPACEARGQHWIPSSIVRILIFRDRVSLNLEQTNLAREDGQGAQESAWPHLPGVKIHVCVQLFRWMLDIQTGSNACIR